MRKLAFTICFLLLTACFDRTGIAQEASQSAPDHQVSEAAVHFFHLLFVVQEVGPDGKPNNSRSYTATVSTESRDIATTIRTNSRIAIATGSFSSEANKEQVNNTQYQYVNLGVNIDVNATREIGRRLSTRITADISSLGDSSDANSHQPTIRENKWQATVLIPLDKPTVVFTSDSLDNKGSMQMVVTATALQ
jgi:hypothetical protein